MTGQAVIESGLHYPVAFGATGAALPENAVSLAYLNQSIMGLVSACQRLMPLGQAAAAKIIWNLKPAMARACQSSMQTEEALCFNPFLELASMRHGSIETRLFIS
jgi:urease accessory protein UreF